MNDTRHTASASPIDPLDLARVHNAAWACIANDDRLTAARRRLSLYELRIVVEHIAAAMLAAYKSDEKDLQP